MALAGVFGAAISRASPADPASDEWDVLNLVNRERRAAGLRPLAMVDGARAVARQWSGAMAGADRLAHNPNLFPDLERYFPGATGMAENVGLAASAAELHGAFMRSPGHRANILGAFRYVGIGVRYSGRGMWLTMDLVDQPQSAPFTLRVAATRVAGASDPDTSVLVSRRLGSGSAGAVVVARSDDFADALAGSALAARHRGPLLLSPQGAAPQNLVDEARRVLPPQGTVYLLGGPAALGPQIEVQFVGAGLRVVRLGGSDRFATAAAVAPHVNPEPAEVLLVSGTAFADAVVAGAPAGALGAPILLVAPTSVPAATELYLAAHSSARRWLIGGPAAVSQEVATEVAITERVHGADRYATAVAVALKWFPSARRLALASGARFQDALVASAEAGRDGFPVVLAAWPVPDSTYAYVGARAPVWQSALVVGRPVDLVDDTLVLCLS